MPAEHCLFSSGAEVLKDALAKMGLKCGGTMRQRAERLMLIKTTPLEQLDRKLFAKGVVPAVSPSYVHHVFLSDRSTTSTCTILHQRASAPPAVFEQ